MCRYNCSTSEDKRKQVMGYFCSKLRCHKLNSIILQDAICSFRATYSSLRYFMIADKATKSWKLF
jgi:hypothetical protein